MTVEDIQKLGAMLAELRNHHQAIAEVIDEFLNYLGAPFEEKKPEVYDQLPWEAREGAKGSFQMVSKRSTNNSDLYRHLFNIVKVNTVDAGKFSHSIGPHFYWIGKEGDAIFRRKRRDDK